MRTTRYYYLVFDSPEHQTHNGYTDKLFLYAIYIRDRVKIILDADTDAVHVGYVDVDNQVDAVTVISERFPYSEVTGACAIWLTYMKYTERLFCLTDTEVDLADEYDAYNATFYNDEPCPDMMVFDCLWKLVSVIKVFTTDESVKRFADHVNRIITWYMMVILNLFSYSAMIDEFTYKFKTYINQVFPERQSKLDFLMKQYYVGYSDLHDVNTDHYLTILGDGINAWDMTNTELNAYNSIIDSVARR